MALWKQVGEQKINAQTSGKRGYGEVVAEFKSSIPSSKMGILPLLPSVLFVTTMTF